MEEKCLTDQQIVQLYLDEIRKIPILDQEEKQAQIRRLAEGDKEAVNYLAAEYLEMVVTIAWEYNGRGLHILDLIQEGNYGLAKAVETFDWGSDRAEFPAFAEKWIRRAIDQAFECACIDRQIPVEQIEKINNIMQARKKLQEELNREPTAQEVAREMGIPQEEIEKMVHFSEEDPEEVIELDLEEPEDSEPVSPEEMIRWVLKNDERITDREKEVICHRLGLDGNGPHSPEETAEAFGVTRERIRMIENKVMRRIHVRNRSKNLRDFYT